MRVLAAVVVLMAAACSVGGPTTLPMQIEAVQVRVAESTPPQVTASVRGIIPDACSSFGSVHQQRDGNAIRLTITVRRLDEMACAPRIEIFARDVPLDGPFPAGVYSVSVNGFVTAFVV